MGETNRFFESRDTKTNTKHDFSRREKDRDVLLRDAFMKIRTEMEEHLGAINENTNEIQSNYEFLTALDAKIEKMAERLDEMYLMLDKRQSPKALEVQTLTFREREVFMAIYALSENSRPTFLDVSRRVGLSEGMAKAYVENLIAKGVPVIRQVISGEIYLSIDPSFRQMQAKENILGIDEEIAQKVA